MAKRRKTRLNRSVTYVPDLDEPSSSTDIELDLLLATDNRSWKMAFGRFRIREEIYRDGQERAM